MSIELVGLILVCLIVFCFGFVLLFGAPYVPTLTPQVTAALDLAGLKPGQTLLELGCGDGKVLIAAAERGWSAVGYELNPIIALVAWLRTRRYGKQVRVICGNFWLRRWPPADAIFVFLLDKYMSKLDRAIVALPTPPRRVVSFAFQIPGKSAAEVRNGIYMYEYAPTSSEEK